MKEIEVGTKVLVRAEVDAFRTGLNSGVLIRVDVNGQKIWVRSEDIQMMRDDVEAICSDTPKELRLPRGSAKWDSIMDELKFNRNPEEVAAEETDGDL